MLKTWSSTSLNMHAERKHLTKQKSSTGTTTFSNTPDEELYLANCARYQIPVDTSIVISLRSRWHKLEVDQAQLLALIEVLCEAPHTDSCSEGGGLHLSDSEEFLGGNLGIRQRQHNKHSPRASSPLAHEAGHAHTTSAPRPTLPAPTSPTHYITTLKIRPNSYKGQGNSSARMLRHILANNRSITHLNLTYVGLDLMGISEICAGLRQNSALESLMLRGNYICDESIERLESALATHQGLRQVDISNLGLGYQQINTLRRTVESTVTTVRSDMLELVGIYEGNHQFVEVLNCITHGLGMIVSVVGMYQLHAEADRNAHVLVSLSDGRPLSPDPLTRKFCCGIFCTMLFLLYTASTLYHGFFLFDTTKRIFQILDHVCIYLFIAGCYTPILTIALYKFEYMFLGIPITNITLLVIQWVIAVGGGLFHILSDLNQTYVQVTELMLYAGQGGMILFPPIWEVFLANIPPEGVRLVSYAGIVYGVGIAFFVAGNTIPIYHAIWHCFVLAGSVLHFLAVYHYIVPIGFHDDGMPFANATSA